jgi:hypothetical protein
VARGRGGCGALALVPHRSPEQSSQFQKTKKIEPNEKHDISEILKNPRLNLFFKNKKLYFLLNSVNFTSLKSKKFQTEIVNPAPEQWRP